MIELYRSDRQILKNEINTSSSPHNVIIVSGARQVGKTSLIESILKEYQKSLSFNLEDDLVFKKEIDQTNSFSEFTALMKNKGLDLQKKQILFIDEAQESEKLGSYVRFMKEKWSDVQCILSGSSMSRIFRKDQRIPVGRISRFLIQPLSLEEFFQIGKFSAFYQEALEQFDKTKVNGGVSEFIHNKLLEAVDVYLKIGGLPEVITSYLDGKDYQYTRSSILAEQEEDFIRKADIKEKYLFLQALRGISNNLGSTSKYTHYADSSREGKQIISILENWHLVTEVEQKGNNTTTNFYPKRYIYDLGIAQDLRNIPFQSLSLLNTKNQIIRGSLGGIFENLVLNSLLSSLKGLVSISSWKEKTQNDTEVDFIYRQLDNLPIEVKASLKPTSRHFNNLRKYLEITDQKIGVLVTAAPFKHIKEGRSELYNVPIYFLNYNFLKDL